MSRVPLASSAPRWSRVRFLFGSGARRPAGDPVPVDARSISARWFWLTYDFRRGRRLPGLPVFDASARAFDRVLAGGEPGEGWMSGRPFALHDAERLAAGRLVHDEVVREVRRVILQDGPMDLPTAVLIWLVKYGEGGTPLMLRVICPRPLERLRVRRRLHAVRPRIADQAGPALADTILQMLGELRSSTLAASAPMDPFPFGG